MTKNQIIAKAMLTTLGIYAVVDFISILGYSSHVDILSWHILTIVSLIAVVLFFVIRTFVFKNDSLASKIVGQAETSEDFDRKVYLIKAFRIAFTILGLLLLSGSRIFLNAIKLLQALSPPNIRAWITDAINKSFNISKDIDIYFIYFIKLFVIVYLLYGAPHIIRWHLKNSCLNQKPEGTTNE